MQASIVLSAAFSFLLATAVFAEEARLLRQPAISENHVAFVYANDIWLVDTDGGEARRITTFPGAEFQPHFSRDGTRIALSGEYDGNIDVYVVDVEGGEPQRLTWHPGPDLVRGWTPDDRVLFASGRTSAPRQYLYKFWTIGLDGGLPNVLPVPRLLEGQLSPHGRRLAYQMVFQWESEWRHYRGGQNNPIRIIDLKTHDVEKLPWDGANDKNPVWLGERIFFLSDRDHVVNVWTYDLKAEKLEQLTFFTDADCGDLEGGAGQLVFTNSGYLYTLDAGGGTPERLSVQLRGDFPWARPHWESVDGLIRGRAISPKGKRAVFSARGDIFTVPAEKGSIRNLTRSPGVADRTPAWSPDGTRISWFSDAGGEYQLVIADQFGKNQTTMRLDHPTFYYTPKWSPDSEHISFADADRNLWVANVAEGKAELIDNEGFSHPYRTIYPEWSPDSKWIAYTKRLPNQYNVIFVYSLEQRKSFQLTDGLSDCLSPAWDANGKYLYFMSSTDYGLQVGWLDMSSIDRPLSRAIYLAVLAADEPSPILPESDDEKPEEEKEEDNGEDGEDKKSEDGDDDDKEPVDVHIDFNGLDQRIIALDIPARNYATLLAGEEGVIYYSEHVPNEDGMRLHRYSLQDREGKQVLDGIEDVLVSADGKKLLYRTHDDVWEIADAGEEIEPIDEALPVDGMRMKVDPKAEWEQMFREAWRYQRDYFYVDNVHGLDLDWVYETYSPWVANVRHRADLTYILDKLGGETAIGHSFTGGGDWPEVDRVPVGLLGADFEVNRGRYRIVKIYTGENWNPELRAPLSGPGIDVSGGDYVLAVNGDALDAGMNLYSLFDRTADEQTALLVNDQPDTSGAREVTVVPVKSEAALRQRDWVESNRRKVDELTYGRIAYVWLPNTSRAGQRSFNRYYFAQQDRKGAIIDERFNHGGYIADYIVDLLSRKLLGYFNNPLGDRQPFTAPNAAVWGPKVMIINEMAGSGGDMLPYMFRLKEIGPLVGTRTWGGLVGVWDVPPLIDGGYITAPRGGFYNLEGEWDVENIGVAPDIEVEQDPKLVNMGHDPQLEKAVDVALELLKDEEVRIRPQPPDPIRVRRPRR